MAPERLCVLLALVLALSGCSGAQAGPNTAASTSSGTAGPASAGATTGGIEGTVTDDSVNPIAGVDVALIELDRSATTDDAGRFSFSEVAPGRVKVVAGKLGYESVARAVDIETGKVAQVNLVLASVAIAVPHHLTVSQEGFIGCGVNARHPADTSGTNSYVAACGPLYYYVSPDLDRFRLDWPLGPTKDMAGLWVETSWRSTQPAGHGLFIWWTFVGASITTLTRVTGTSPLAARVEADNVTASGCAAKNCTITSFHYPYANTIGPTSPIDVAVTVQQRLTDYVTVFRGGELPNQFSALPKT